MPRNTAGTLRSSLVAGIAAATAFAWAPPGDARVTRIVIDTAGAVTGQIAATTGYEELTGRAWGELDPRDPKNQLITDIKLARSETRTATVEYIASFRIRKPRRHQPSSSGLMLARRAESGRRRGTDRRPARRGRHAAPERLAGRQRRARTRACRANVDCLPTLRRTVRGPGVHQSLREDSGPRQASPGRSSPASSTAAATNAAPLNVMGNPIPYFPVESGRRTPATR